jgi:cystathionine beta-synthase
VSVAPTTPPPAVAGGPAAPPARARTVLDAIGATPLVELARLRPPAGPALLAKLELLNPGGSVKDRICLRMVETAERAGRLRPGGTIVEATSGNTGQSLAMIAAIRGYRCVLVVPDKTALEKRATMAAYGAEVVVTPTAVPPESPRSYYQVAATLAASIPGAFQPNQYANPDNPAAHYETLGPEIWEQTGGAVDVLVAGVGTGGTISGVGRYLKERRPGVTVVGADPDGSIYSGGEPHPYLVEGIGKNFWPATFDRAVVDRYVRVRDDDSFRTARLLARREGILVGGSGGTALYAAMRVAPELPAGATVVVILPDTGRNNLSTVHGIPQP